MTTEKENKEPRSTKEIIFKISALSVPAAILLTASFLPLKPILQQGLVGITLIWIYVGATIGFSFLE